MYKFCKAMIAVFGVVCLREPNVTETARLLLINKARGFWGMIEALYEMGVEEVAFCMAGAVYMELEGCIVILEAVASHIYGFGTLSSELLVLTMTSTCSSSIRYCLGLQKAMINGHAYNKCYYLADGIYPDWFILVKTIRGPEEEKKSICQTKRGM
jgi:hypothetical protein